MGIDSFGAGSLADKYGFKPVLVGGLAAFAISYAIFSRNASLPLLVAAFTIYALFSAASDGIVKAWQSTQLPAHRLGAGIGLANSLVSLAFLVSSILTGLLWQLFSPALALGVLSAAMLLPIIYFLWLVPNTDITARPSNT